MKKLLKRLLIALAALAVCGVILYFFATSSFFLTKFVLPRAGKAAGIELSASKISLSPLRGILRAKDLSAADPADHKVFFSCADFETSVSVFSLLGGGVTVYSLRTENIKIDLEKRPESVWNVPPMNGPSKPDTEPKKSASVPAVRIDSASIKNLSLSFTDKSKPEKPLSLSLGNFNLECSGVKPGSDARAVIDGVFSMSGHKTDIKNASAHLEAAAKLGPGLMPAGASLDFALDKIRGSLAGDSMDGGALSLVCKCAPGSSPGSLVINEIKFAELSDGRELSSLDTSGTLSLSPLAFELETKLRTDSSKALPAILRAAGIDFGGAPSASYKGKIAYGPDRIFSSGAFKLSEIPPGVTSAVPAEMFEGLEISLSHNAEWNAKDMTLSVSEFKGAFRGGKNGSAGFNLKKAAGVSFKDKTFSLTSESPEVSVSAKNVNLSKLAFLIPKSSGVRLEGGLLSAGLSAAMSGSGQSVVLNGGAEISGLNLKKGQDEFKNLGLSLKIDKGIEFSPAEKRLLINSFLLALQTGPESKLSAEIKTPAEISFPPFKTGVGDKTPRVTVAASNFNLAPLNAFIPKNPGFELEGGSLTANLLSSVTQDGGAFSLSGAAGVSGFAAKICGKEIKGLEIAFKTDKGADFYLGDKRLLVNSLLLAVQNGPESKLSAEIKTPAEIFLSPLKPGAGEKAPVFLVSASNFNLEPFGSFIPQDSGFELKSGALSANIEARAENSFDNVSMEAFALLSNLSAPNKFFPLDKTSVKLNVKIRLAGRDALCCDDVSLSVSRDSRVAANLKFGADVSLKEKDVKFSVQKLEINDGASAFLPEKMSGRDMIARLTRSLAPFTLTLSGAGDYAQASKQLAVDRCSLALDTKSCGSMSLSPKKSFVIPLSKDGYKTAPVSAGFIAKNFILSSLNPLFPADKFSARAGALNADFIADADIIKNDMSASGEIDVSDMDFKAGGREFKKFGLKNKFAVSFKDNAVLTLKSVQSSLSAGGKEVLRTVCKGAFDFKKGSREVDCEIIDAGQDMRGLLNSLNAEASKVKNQKVKGFLKWRNQSAAHNINGDITLSDIGSLISPEPPDAPYPAAMKFDAEIGQEMIKTDVSEFKISKGRESVADCLLNAEITQPLSAGVSKVKLSSKMVDIKEIMALLKKPETPGQTAGQTPIPPAAPAPRTAAEPGPVDMKGLSLDLWINLQNLRYGKNINCGVNTFAQVRNNIVQAKSINVLLNRASGDIGAEINLGEKNGWSYKSRGSLSSLQLPPLLKELSGNAAVDDSKGELSKLDFTVRGKGFTKESLRKNLCGDISAEFSGISLPSSAKSLPIINILILPCEMLSNFMITNKSSFAESVTNIFSMSDKVTKGLRSVDFDTGSLAVNAENGVIGVKKCLFKGSPIDSFSCLGTVDYDGNLQLNLEMKTVGLTVPVDISGTTSKPKVNVESFAKILLNKDNLSTVTNIYDTIKSGEAKNAIQTITDGLGKFLEKK